MADFSAKARRYTESAPPRLLTREAILALPNAPVGKRASDLPPPAGLVRTSLANLSLRVQLEEIDGVVGLPTPALLRGRLRRGIRLFGKDRLALALEAAGRPETALLEEALLEARWKARRELHAAGGGRLPAPVFDRWEDKLTARYLRRRLGSDETRRRVVGLTKIPAATLAVDPPNMFATEDVVVRFASVVAAATTQQRKQLFHVLAVLRERPAATFAGAAKVAGLSTDQRKKLTTRLRQRLA